MPARSTSTNYGSVAQALHWVSALLIIALIPLGIIMTRVGDGSNDWLYRAHVGIGMLVALLTVARVIWHFREPTPTPPPLPRWRTALFVGNHYALYVLLLLLTISGIGTLLASDLTPFPPDVVAADVEDGTARDAHFALALIYTGLLFMHIAGVLSYQRTKGDVLSRMGINSNIGGWNGPHTTAD